tara:strand:- start:126 stop:419 length:294 start_codon:yes stop_codon:yes gene_type:complete
MKKIKEKEVKELVGEMECVVKYYINKILEYYIYGGDLDSDLWDNLTDENKKLIDEIDDISSDKDEDTFSKIRETIQDSLDTSVEFDTEIDELLKRLV